MRVGKALKLVMSMWHISNHRLSQLSGVGKPTIGKLIRGEHKSASWDKVEQLANGLEQVHLFAKVAFMAVLPLPDDAFEELRNLETGYEPFYEREKPENIAAVIEALEVLDLIDQEAAKKFRVKLEAPLFSPISFEERIGHIMQQIRREKAKQEEEEEESDE